MVNWYDGTYAKMVNWFECCTPEPQPAVRSLAGTFKLLFNFNFKFFFSELNIVKVINCFFFFRLILLIFFFKLISNHVYKNISLPQYCVTR